MHYAKEFLSEFRGIYGQEAKMQMTRDPGLILTPSSSHLQRNRARKPVECVSWVVHYKFQKSLNPERQFCLIHSYV